MKDPRLRNFVPLEGPGLLIEVLNRAMLSRCTSKPDVNLDAPWYHLDHTMAMVGLAHRLRLRQC